MTVGGGAGSGNLMVVVIGDSTVVRYFPTLSTILFSKNYQAQVMGLITCSILSTEI